MRKREEIGSAKVGLRLAKSGKVENGESGMSGNESGMKETAILEDSPLQNPVSTPEKRLLPHRIHQRRSIKTGKRRYIFP